MTEAPIASSTSRWARHLPQLIKVLVLAAFGLFLARRPELIVASWTALTRTSWAWWLGAVGLVFVSQWTAARRTQALLQAYGHRESAPVLFVELVQAVGLNSVFVGAGVLFRVAQIRRRIGSAERAFTVVIVDRLLGAAALLVGAALSFGLHGGRRLELHVDLGLVLAVSAAGLAVAGAAALVFPQRTRGFVSSLVPALAAVRREPRLLATVLVHSILGYLAVVLNGQFLGEGMGLRVGFGAYAYAVAAVAVATMVPVSVGGVGVREAGYALLLHSEGVTGAESIALGVLQYSSHLAASLAGIALYFVLGGRVPTRSADEAGG